jgi:hypothetical protein
MVRFITIKKFAEESGYSPDAVRSKIKRGDWLQGEVWLKALDGRILIDREGYEKWVMRGKGGSGKVYGSGAAPR